jgi:hypothetical protein
LTINGRIEVRRIRWWAAGAGSQTPVDPLLDAAEATISVGVQELCCRLTIAGGSFARSAENLKRAASLSLSEETLRTVVEHDGHAVLRAAQEEQLEIDWSAAQCKTRRPTGQEVSRIYVSADGVLVPVTTAQEKQKRRATVLRQRQAKPRRRGHRKPPLSAVNAGADQRYKQFYLTAFYDQQQEHRLVSVTRKDHHGLGKLLRRDAARLRIAAAEERVGLVDGAVCLQQHLANLELTAVGLDFYHLGEHVHAARRGTFGEDVPAGQEWAGDVLHTARHEGYKPFWEKLCDWRGRQRGSIRRPCADGLLHYVAQRQTMIQYDHFEQQGWNIGSGPIEAMCKATTRRLKGPGMRWDSDNAESIMALESLYQSQPWDRYWTKVLWHRN